MKLISLIDEDFVNYKKPSMVLGFPFCDFKCGKENCQNASLDGAQTIDISYEEVVDRFLESEVSEAIVLAGLEPMDSLVDVKNLVDELRRVRGNASDIVIYTGYTEEELRPKLQFIKRECGWGIGENIYIKYGRYIPEEEPYFNELLGITLAGRNQGAKPFYEVGRESDDKAK